MAKLSYLHGSASKARETMIDNRSRDLFEKISRLAQPGFDIGGDVWLLIFTNRETNRRIVLDHFRSQEEAEVSGTIVHDTIKALGPPFPWALKISHIKVGNKPVL